MRAQRESAWSPLPFVVRRGPLSKEERERYREHVAAHPDPEYHGGWYRPTQKTAEAVWELLAPRLRLKLDDLLLSPAIRLPDDKLTAKQALVVAVDAVVLAGQQGRMLTTNTVFDALARHWSDHYRWAIEHTLREPTRRGKIAT